MTKNNLQGLDILKILAATFIVMHHYQQVFKLEFSGINFYGGFFNFGFLVELFFMISGFLTLYSNKVGGTARKLIHKLLRIYPMATIACATTLVVKSIGAEDIHGLWNARALIANFFWLFLDGRYFQ